ncbi:MAG: c-type cytochrome [Alphaproteobacteria bacterium]|nr:c-type cytochrome [Alphaproteobacteria bacterium]
MHKDTGSWAMIGILRCAAMLAIVTAALTAPAHAETLLQRGTYLMRSIVACGNCHTPKGPKGDIPGMELAGMAPMAKEPGFTANAPNITPDRETGIGTWTDAQIITAIREGRRPNGKIIGPPMPIALYRGLSDRDAKAIVAYLRTVKPIKNAIPDSVYDIHLPPAYGPPVESVADVPESDKLAYGAYLAGPAGHCIECHSPMGERGPDIQNNLGAGGFEFHGPWGVSVSANITPTGLQDRTDAQIKTMITKGLRPDGSPLMPPMAYAYYANIKDRDLDAIIAYLRALPAK